MGNPVLGRFNKPQSIAQLTRGRGWNSELVGFLLPMARQDFIYIEDDFVTAISTAHWTVGTDAGSTAFAYVAIEGGALRGATEAAANDYISVKHTAVIFDAARHPGCEVRWKADVVDSYKSEVGFSDPLTDDTLTAINDIDTPTTTNGATDLVVIGRDTGQTLTTCALVSDGTTDAAAKTNFNTAKIPTAATYTTYLVQAYANAGYGVIDNDPLNGSAGVSSGPDTGILLRPHFTLGTLANAAVTVDLDYFRIWAERA